MVIEYLLKDEVLKLLLGFNNNDFLIDEMITKCTVKEVGDGNLNFVYIVTGTNSINYSNTVVVKQALPYVRCVGENWPLTLDRATFEYQALVKEYNLCPEHVPKVYKFDVTKALIVMEYIKPPHLILRKQMLNGVINNTFVCHVAQFLAKTLFGTSGIKLNGEELRQQISLWSKNSSMCALTEQVIFTDPYYNAKFNHWESISPELDNTIKEGIYNDIILKNGINNLKNKFLSNTQALLHGDLHTGSIMTSPNGTTYIIDPEFAFYGPMGFDIGI